MDWTWYLFGFKGRVNRAKYWLATLIKRLHDRDKSGWWMVPFFFIPGLYEQFAERLPDSYLVLPLAVIVFVF